ncbi:MAG TPA: hypothetical protein VF109_05035 [Mycobacteriales bacterium]
MYATVHDIDGVPGPQDRGWVDAVLIALRSRAVPAGALVAAPLGMDPGCVVALWDEEPDPAGPAGGFTTGRVTVRASAPYEVTGRRAGTSGGPARFLQLTVFTGRSPEWCTAYDRAGEERIWPAVRDVPGVVETVLGGNATGDRVAVVLAESVDALEATVAAIMSTELLPWEDPANMTGPDGARVLRLLHADLPAGATR